MGKNFAISAKNLSFKSLNEKYFSNVELLAIKANNKIFDSFTVFNEKLTNILPITDKKSLDYFLILNHSCAHILAYAVKNLYQDVNLWIGPASSDGFFYDFYFQNDKVIDLEKITLEMKKIIKNNFNFEKNIVKKSNALAFFKSDPLKLLLLKSLKEPISFYKIGNFVDLCKGPHVKNTVECKNFSLLSCKKIILNLEQHSYEITRISGVCFAFKDDLEGYLKELSTLKQYDHREVNKLQRLFFFEEKAGQGLPFLLPNGYFVVNKVANLISLIEKEFGYQRVTTPVLGSLELYQKSGHYAHYKENIFPEISLPSEKLLLRPMACPHHCLIFQKLIQSYRQLPLRLSEEVLQFRYEYSGGLTGLERVRMMHLTDGHIFVAEKDLFKELKKVFKLILKILALLKITDYYVVLATNDPQDQENFLSNQKLWNRATEKLRKVITSKKLIFEEKPGEAAFYGPKIDIEVKTSLNKKITLSTIQLDYFLPQKFGLSFTNEQNLKETPVLIHRGLIGTYERFLAVIIENNQGNLPFFLSPFQVNIIYLDKKFLPFCNVVKNKLKKNNFSCQIDESDKSFNLKIRNSQKIKYWYTLIIGDKEVQSNTVTYREYQEKISKICTLKSFLEELKTKRNFLKKYWNII